MSVAAYKATIRQSESPRQIERRLLSQLSGRLEAEAPAFDLASTRTERLSLLAGGLRETLTETQTLWSGLRHDLAEPGNALPEALRGQLLSLSLWIDREITRALGGEGSLGPIVAVNRAVADGLAGQMPGPQA